MRHPPAFARPGESNETEKGKVHWIIRDAAPPRKRKTNEYYLLDSRYTGEAELRTFIDQAVARGVARERIIFVPVDQHLVMMVKGQPY
jgi:hypothetical protein